MNEDTRQSALSTRSPAGVAPFHPCTVPLEELLDAVRASGTVLFPSEAR